MLYQLVDTVVDMSRHKEALNILLPARALDCRTGKKSKSKSHLGLLKNRIPSTKYKMN